MLRWWVWQAVSFVFQIIQQLCFPNHFQFYNKLPILLEWYARFYERAVASNWSRKLIETSKARFQLKLFGKSFSSAHFLFLWSQWWCWSKIPWQSHSCSWGLDRGYPFRCHLQQLQWEVQWRLFLRLVWKCGWYGIWIFKDFFWSQRFCFRGEDRFPWGAGSGHLVGSVRFRPISYSCDAWMNPFCNLFKLKMTIKDDCLK